MGDLHSAICMAVAPDEPVDLWAYDAEVEAAVQRAEQQAASKAERGAALAAGPGSAESSSSAVPQERSGRPPAPTDGAGTGTAPPPQPGHYPFRDLPDVEELGLVYDRLAACRPSGYIRVTDLAASEWCQQSAAFSLAHAGLVVRASEAMSAGTAVHQRLQEEVSELVPFAAVPQTREDWWALQLAALTCRLLLLLQRGAAPEVPLYGVVEGTLVVGIVDLMELLLVLDGEHGGQDRQHEERAAPADQQGGRGGGTGVAGGSVGGRGSDAAPPDVPAASSRAAAAPSPSPCASASAPAPGSPPPPVPQHSAPAHLGGGAGQGGPCVRLTEFKTRRTATLPAPAQKDTAALQLLIYVRLWAGLRGAASHEALLEPLMSHLGLDGGAPLSPGVRAEAEAACVAAGPSPLPTLAAVAQQLHRVLQLLPDQCSDSHHVKYLLQVGLYSVRPRWGRGRRVAGRGGPPTPWPLCAVRIVGKQASPAGGGCKAQPSSRRPRRRPAACW